MHYDFTHHLRIVTCSFGNTVLTLIVFSFDLLNRPKPVYLSELEHQDFSRSVISIETIISVYDPLVSSKLRNDSRTLAFV